MIDIYNLVIHQFSSRSFWSYHTHTRTQVFFFSKSASFWLRDVYKTKITIPRIFDDYNFFPCYEKVKYPSITAKHRCKNWTGFTNHFTRIIMYIFLNIFFTFSTVNKTVLRRFLEEKYAQVFCIRGKSMPKYLGFSR